jgi:hypothetical protein
MRFDYGIGLVRFAFVCVVCGLSRDLSTIDLDGGCKLF